MTPHYYELTTIYDALRANLITWGSVLDNQGEHIGRCANGCNAVASGRTLDGQHLCATCYLPIARQETAQIFGEVPE